MVFLQCFMHRKSVFRVPDKFSIVSVHGCMHLNGDKTTIDLSVHSVYIHIQLRPIADTIYGWAGMWIFNMLFLGYPAVNRMILRGGWPRRFLDKLRNVQEPQIELDFGRTVSETSHCHLVSKFEILGLIFLSNYFFMSVNLPEQIFFQYLSKSGHGIKNKPLI